MILSLKTVPPVKGPNDPSYKGQVPARMRYLAPDAADSLARLEKDTGGLVYSDMWRSAESSLLARRIKRGVQPPAYSSHNFGLAVDLDLDSIIKGGPLRHYMDILEVMKNHGWYCHRRDGQGPDQMEAWHFNYLGDDPSKYLEKATGDHITWARVAEERIYERYGTQFSLSPAQVQSGLKALGFYQGEVDGDFGAQSREATMAFQRAWCLAEDGQPGPQTQRTLAFVTATKNIV